MTGESDLLPNPATRARYGARSTSPRLHLDAFSRTRPRRVNGDTTGDEEGHRPPSQRYRQHRRSDPILTWDVWVPLVTHSRPDWILHQILMVLSVPEGRQGPIETAFRPPANPFPGQGKDLGHGHRSERWMGVTDVTESRTSHLGSGRRITGERSIWSHDSEARSTPLPILAPERHQRRLRDSHHLTKGQPHPVPESRCAVEVT